MNARDILERYLAEARKELIRARAKLSYWRAWQAKPDHRPEVDRRVEEAEQEVQSWARQVAALERLLAEEQE